jgi:hypothetical protein
MPNGRLHDNPVSDIVIWGQEVYGEELDALVREVAAMLPRELGTDADGEPVDSPFDQPPLVGLIFKAQKNAELRPRLREELVALRDRLRTG